MKIEFHDNDVPEMRFIGKQQFFPHRSHIQISIIDFFFSWQFQRSFFRSRQQIPQWPSREHHDSITMVPLNSSSSPTSKTASARSLMHQNSLEQTHHKTNHDLPQTTSVKGATENLFELLERCQSQRLDDQRCVLPSYFSQVFISLFL